MNRFIAWVNDDHSEWLEEYQKNFTPSEWSLMNGQINFDCLSANDDMDAD